MHWAQQAFQDAEDAVAGRGELAILKVQGQYVVWSCDDRLVFCTMSFCLIAPPPPRSPLFPKQAAGDGLSRRRRTKRTTGRATPRSMVLCSPRARSMVTAKPRTTTRCSTAAAAAKTTTTIATTKAAAAAASGPKAGTWPQLPRRGGARRGAQCERGCSRGRWWR